MADCFDVHKNTSQNNYLIQKKLYVLTKPGVSNGVKGYSLYLMKKNCDMGRCG